MLSTRFYLRIATVLVLLCAIQLPISGQQSVSQTGNVNSVDYAPPGKETYLKLADEMEAALRHDVLGVWFPRSIDKVNGGFYSNFTRDWKLGPSEGKFSVFQGRMTWVAARIVIARPDLKDQFRPIIDHGIKYLSEVL